MVKVNTTILDNIIVGRIAPHIYAFRTNTVPDYLKVGDTYRSVNVRIKEWQDRFPDLEHKINWEWTAKTENGKYFRDFAVHYYLETLRGLHRLQPSDIPDLPYYSKEFFENATPEDVDNAIIDIETYANSMDGSRQYQFYTEERLPEEIHFSRTENFPPRPNQDTAIENFKKARDAGRRNLLMYAVMRFGKSFTAMCCATEMVHNTMVLIVSAKADVKNEWKKTVESHVRFEDYIFLDSESLLRDNKAITNNIAKGKKVALFLTLQDLQGEDVKDKHKDLFCHDIDLLIVDETHYGARAEKYGEVLRKANGQREKLVKKELAASGECTYEDLEETLRIVKKLNIDTTLHLSGTPYRILMGSEFKPQDIIAFYQFTDIIDEKERWDKEHSQDDDYKEWDNPYYGFPQMIRFAFNPNESARKLMDSLKNEGKSGQLNELFAPKATAKDSSREKKHLSFKHEKEVLDLLSVIDGSAEDDNLLSFLDYDKIKDGKMCRHIVFVLPWRASCDAMEQLLKDKKSSFKNLRDYEIINIAGLEAVYSTSDEIKAKIKEIESGGGKSVTLTVNKMLTGSTVPEWDTMLFLKDVSSPQEYDQAIFRLQNQYVTTYKDEKGDDIKYNMKPQTLLVDFSPNRMFIMQEQKSKIYNVNTNERGNDELEERLRREIEISPIIVYNKGKIGQVSPTDIMDVVRNYSADKTVMDEATTVPTDMEMLNDPNLWDMIKDFDPIDNKRGLNVKPYEGEGDNYDEPEDDNGDTSSKKNKGNATSSPDSKEKDDEKRDKRLAAFFARILFFALLTEDRVKSLKQVKDAIKRSDDNKRIARNVGLPFQKLCYLAKHLDPFILSDLDYKINTINDLLSDETYTPVERVERALTKFGRLSVSEIVTPSKVADEVVAMLPQDRLSSKSRFLDIASKQGEFTCALYKRFGEKCKNNIYALPTSDLSYEFTRKVFEMLGIPVDNIISSFNSYDLIGDNKEKYIELLKDMKFNAIVGNPPYQVMDKGEHSSSSSTPIYNLFVEASNEISQGLSSLIMPARWYAGGKGLDEFRSRMTADRHIAVLHDYIDAGQVFPGVQIEGGICYILRDTTHNSKCNVYIHSGNNVESSSRYLDAGGSDVFIRYTLSVEVYKKVRDITDTFFSDLILPRKPFGIDTILPKELCSNKIKGGYDVLLLINRNRTVKYLKPDFSIPSGRELIGKYKIFISKADGAAGQVGNPIPANVIGKSEAGGKKSICTETFLAIGPFETEVEMGNARKYMDTRFFRFLVGIRKTKNMTNKTYSFVPLQDFTSNSDIDWTKPIDKIDEALFKKYNLSDDEIAFIKKTIKPRM